MLTSRQASLLGGIVGLGDERKLRLFVVGGIIRDILLGTPGLDKDIDIVVEGDATEFAGLCAERLGSKLKTFPKFVTAKIDGLPGDSGFREIDFASARKESYPRPGALPVVRPSSIEDDLRRRDFSINAIALPLRSLCNLSGSREAVVAAVRTECLDLHGGLEDLEARLVRVLHAGSFVDDPTRVYRALRYAGRIGGSLEHGTEGLLADAVSRGALGTVSEFRLFTEVRKILIEDRALVSLELMERYGVVDAYLPYPRSGHERFKDLLRTMNALGPDITALRAEILPRLMLHVGGERTAESLAKVGIGKKALAAMAGEVESARTGDPGPEKNPVVAALRKILERE